MALCIIGGLVLGLVGGFGIAYLFMSKPTIGTMRIDHSIEDEEPMIFLEIDRGSLPYLDNSSKVVVKVSHKNYVEDRN